ncbi:MAG: hypothetical protein WCI73_12450 [Phycisphaerae bacterium]
MAADYREQYRLDQLEPFWPNEIIKMGVVVLCTLAVIMAFAVLPVVLEELGITSAQHHEEPANPRGATPVGIKPEWYFLATYQYLRLMPTSFLGVSGKTLGVLSQGVVMPVVVLLPFWYRKRAARRPGWLYRAAVTVAIGGFLTLTLWGGWPEDASGEEVPLGEYLRERPTMFVLVGVALVIFYVMIAHERNAIRRLLDSPAPPTPLASPEGAPGSQSPEPKPEEGQ